MTSTDSTEARYRAVPAHIDLPAMEREILTWWGERGTFEQSLDTPDGTPRWTFYEGPPTANGTPGTHHVEARVFKDVFPRFKTMQGFHVDRKAGWDCHGLPVEIAVEKELGFNGKPDIEAFGIADFNARCRESVLRNVDLFEEMTDRMGYWVDMSDPYRTMDTPYVQSVWWALKEIFDQGLLVEDHRVSPYCPRCGTALSDHELAQGYETITDPSVYVRFPLTSGDLLARHPGLTLLVWTTTPWTLVSNTACAVGADLDYVVARTDDGELLVVAEALREKVLGEDSVVVEQIKGHDLVGLSYDRPLKVLDFPDTDAPLHTVLAADFVTTEDGTGIVHEAPAFGADDFVLCRAAGLPIVNPIEPDGHFAADVPLVGGQFFRDANESVNADLTHRGLMFEVLHYEHSYPHCWRCHTPLIYYAMPAWYIRTTQRKAQLIEQNDGTNWYPGNVKHGRYGDWLTNNIDWALSRSRYWGTPLPIWRNDETGSLKCIGSLAELSQLTGRDLSDLDPHRPFIDDVIFTVEGENGTYRRVPEVIDAWFDSGSMPFAQWGYPWAEGSKEKFERAFPAQYICEAIDQTRGWFYSLMAVSTLVFGQNSYENVVCLGHILAEDGKKMSKHLGNILLPMPLMDQHGADAVRWFMACSGSAWSARRIGPTVLEEIVRKVMLTFWNTVAFHALYARAADWSPADAVDAPRTVLDRWLLSQTQSLIAGVTSALESFDTQSAGQQLATFIDDLSNWYVRRSRKRFWNGDVAALSTLHEVIEVLSRLLAPLTPFIAERVWQDIVAPVTPDAAESVHLADWPKVDADAVVDGLAERVALARRITELGRAARAEAKVRTRQPLRRALIGSAHYETLGDDLRAEVCEELNIGQLEPLGNAGDLVEYTAKANFRALGKRFAKRTPVIAAAIAAADAGSLAAALAAGTASIVVEGETIDLGADGVIISEHPSDGWAVVNEHGETVALDLEVDDELRRAGIAREAVRVIQEARKNAGLQITDRIRLTWSAAGETAAAITEHGASIAEEVLAVEFAPGDVVSAADEELGLGFTLTKA